MNHGIICSRSQPLIDQAYRFAVNAHGDQKRKYTGEPYVNHCVEVAKIVQSAGGDIEMICAALLHDTIEDTPVTHEELVKECHGFYAGIADLVLWLSDVSKPEDGNRAVRKTIDRIRIGQAPARAKTIKLADLISNSASIINHDPKFAKTYLAEKRLLLNVLKEGDSTLWSRANDILLANGY